MPPLFWSPTDASVAQRYASATKFPILLSPRNVVVFGSFDGVGNGGDDGIESSDFLPFFHPRGHRFVARCVHDAETVDGGFVVQFDGKEDVAVDAGSSDERAVHLFDSFGMDVAAENYVHVHGSGEFLVTTTEVGEGDDVIDTVITEMGNRFFGGRNRVGELQRTRMGVYRRRFRRRHAEESDTRVVDFPNGVLCGSGTGGESVVTFADVGGEPRLWGPPNEFAGTVDSVIEVVVAERIEIGRDSVEKGQRLLPLR